jgi:two-component system cell cycle sensor histidine kinase/response regulator CckA
MGTPAPQRQVERVAVVVDDEEMVCRYMARVLIDAGLRVLEARDGQEALSLLESLGPSAAGLVVSDVSMPRMNGVELATAIGHRWPAIPVLLVSGRGSPSSDHTGAFLEKPFTPNALLASVEELLASPPTAYTSRSGQA